MTSIRRLTRSPGMNAFRHRNYRLFFIGQAISLVGTWMQQVAQSWLVLVLTHDPLWLGVVAAAQFVPVMFFGLFAGVFADSLPKRQTLLATQAIKMSLSVILAILAVTGLASIPLLILLALVIGTVNSIDMPVRQAFAVEMVGRAEIGNAVALNSAMFNGARIIGPAVAGLTIGAFGVPMAFAIDAVSFLAVIIGLARMRESELHPATRIARPESAGAVMTQLREGLHYVRRTPIVLVAMLVLGLVSTVGMNFTVIMPAYASDALHSDASGYGFLMAASGVGSLLAALRLVFGGPPPPITAAPSWLAPAPKVTTMKATSSPSRSTPLKASAKAVQSRPGPVHSARSSAAPARIPARPRAATLAMPLRNHCSPKTSSSAPTIRRRGPIGIALRARPKTATTTASTRKPATVPMRVARQPRVAPTPTTIVTISMANPPFTGPGDIARD